MKNSSDTIGNRTLPTCNAAPQPTALRGATTLTSTTVLMCTFGYICSCVCPYNADEKLLNLNVILNGFKVKTGTRYNF